MFFKIADLRPFPARQRHIRGRKNIQSNMNPVFAVLFLLSTLLYLFVNPDGFLPAMLSGAEKAVSLALSLAALYCVWLGFFAVLERSGLQKILARKASPLCKRVFRTRDEEAISLVAANLTANFLGLPGAPTPLAVRAVNRFLNAGNEYAADLLFVLNATSLQLLPATVIALRASLGSSAPADVFLPTLLSTLLSTLLGGGLLFLSSGK